MKRRSISQGPLTHSTANAISNARKVKEPAHKVSMGETPVIPVINVVPDCSSCAVRIDTTLLQISNWLISSRIVVASVDCLLLYAVNVQRVIV